MKGMKAAFSRYALVNTEDEQLISVLEKTLGTDEVKNDQRQKQIRITHTLDMEEEPGSLQELAALPHIACRVAVYGGPGLSFPRVPKYFEDYKKAVTHTLDELTEADTHSATIELFAVDGSTAELSEELLAPFGIA